MVAGSCLVHPHSAVWKFFILPAGGNKIFNTPGVLFCLVFFFFFESCFVDELSQDIPYLSEGTFLSRKPLTSFSECFVRDKLHQALNADDTRREKKNETSLFEVCRWILSFNGSRTPGASATAAGARCLLRAGWQCCPNFAVHSQCACAEVGGGGG